MLMVKYDAAYLSALVFYIGIAIVVHGVLTLDRDSIRQRVAAVNS